MFSGRLAHKKTAQNKAAGKEKNEKAKSIINTARYRPQSPESESVSL
jgi:hypothetical protein